MNKHELKSLLENIYHLLAEEAAPPIVSEPEPAQPYPYYTPPPFLGGNLLDDSQEQELRDGWTIATGKPFPEQLGTPPFGPFYFSNLPFGAGGVGYQDANGDWYFWQNGGWVRQQYHTDSPPLPDWLPD